MEYDRGQYAAAAPGIATPGSTNGPGLNDRGTTSGRGPVAAHTTAAYEGAAPQTSVDNRGAAGLRHPTSKPAWGREHLPGPAPNTAGPHRSDILNKLDPRVDSNMSNPRTIHAYAVANPGTMPGPAPNTAGPHRSDLLNKLDPRVDSDLSSLGGNPPIPPRLIAGGGSGGGAYQQQAVGGGGVTQEPAATYRHQHHYSSAGTQGPPPAPMYAEATPDAAGPPHSTTFPGGVGTYAGAPPQGTTSSETAFPPATAPSGFLGNIAQSSYPGHQGAGARDFGSNYDAYGRPDAIYSSHHSRPVNPNLIGSDARFEDSNHPPATRYHQPEEVMSGGAGRPNNAHGVDGGGGQVQYQVPPTAGAGATSAGVTRP